MSSVFEPQSELPNHDELVAYLDGELAPEACRLVEERLAIDAEYRQQLRDLDQAWEALGVLPTTSVDDGFARTTIELACMAAEDDLSQRTARATVEKRGRWRWWIAGGVAAALLGFVAVRALAVHRNNVLLADLPVIEQVNTLRDVSDIAFLRQLSAASFAKDLVSDRPTYDRTLAEFKSANAPTLDERRTWVNSLSPERKAELAERARAFEDLRENPEEKERLRMLANDIRDAKDAVVLQQTLVAYGQWLSLRHNAGKQQQIREDLARLSTPEQISMIGKMVREEDAQASRRLLPADADILRREIIQLAKRTKADLLTNLPAGPERDRIEHMDASEGKAALLFVLRSALQKEGNGENTIDGLISKLSPEANEHWKRIPRWRGDRRLGQLLAWIHEAVPAKPGPGELERFFLSDKLTNSERQELLNKPRSEMEAELERRYLRSELGFEVGEFMRDPRNGFGPGGPDRRGRRSDGPPPGEGPGPDGRPRDRFDRDRLPPPGDRGPRPGDGPGGARPGEGRRQRPPEGRLEGPPEEGPQPPPDGFPPPL